jgi:ABC-type nickel/cobalt efflux system permease component RcnA
MATSLLTLLTLSFLLGLRHALEVDHIAAVATIASARRGMWSSSIVGALWGLGHTAALLLMAGAVIGFGLRIPPSVASMLELGVAVMLIGLGVRLLWSLAAGGVVHWHVHAHGMRMHAHPHVHPPGAREATDPHHAVRTWRRPLLVGLMHGAAGSAGLMMVVLATIPSPALALVYVGVFGVGSIGGMIVMSALVGMPFALAADRFVRVAAGLRIGAALASVAVGLGLAWRIGVESGLWL